MAFDFDEVGLHVGDRAAPVSKVLVSLDHSAELVSHAIKCGAEMVVTHHPLIFRPISRLEPVDHVTRIAMQLLCKRIGMACAHTNWDCADGGVNDVLAAKLGLQRVREIGEAAQRPSWKMAVFCPEEAAHSIIDAASAAGAGRIGAYERCAFWTAGTGTFFGGESTSPSIGRSGTAEQVSELRVEMVVPDALRHAVEAAVKAKHPYEEPAIDFYRLQDQGERRIGRVGELDNSISLNDFVAVVNDRLRTSSAVWGARDLTICRVAVCGGAADEFRSLVGKADVLVTGEVKQHKALEAVEAGVAMIAAGHYATEQPGVEALAFELGKLLPEVGFEVFEPEPGTAGRPWW